MISLIDPCGLPLMATEPAGGDATGGGSDSGYEGAQTTSVRDSFAAFPTNSRRELSSYTRSEFVRKVRALDANLPMVGRLKRKIAQHAAGKGIFVRPITRDRDWNLAARKNFERWASNQWAYSVDESRDHYEDQALAAETIVGDGEFFEALTRLDGDLRVQPLDVFEVCSPRSFDRTTERWQDGVLTNEFDAPRFYGVRELPLPGISTVADARPVPADSILHVFRRRRAKQTRGLSWLYSGVNDGIDALDLKALEKGSAKLHSLLALSVKRKVGDAGQNGITGQLKKALGKDGKVTKLSENFWQGAAITYLADGEEIDLHASGRPSANLLAFLEFLYRELALATDLPLEVVYNLAQLGGTGTRGVLEAAQWLFDLMTDLIVMRHSRRIYLWHTADQMQRGLLPVCKDPEWWAAAYRGPAKLTLDLGRSADAAVKLLKNGALTHVRYHEERAQDAYEEAEEQIQFLKWLKERCADAKIDFSLLIEPTPGTQNNISVHQSEAP